MFEQEMPPYDLAWYDGNKNVSVVSNKEKTKVNYFRGEAPAISPDGKKLAVIETSFSFNEKYSCLLIYDLQTEKFTKIKPQKTKQFHNPRWSPDGLSILVQCNPLMYGPQQLCAIINAQTHKVKYIMLPKEEPITVSSWTRDSRYIVGAGRYTLYLFDRDGNIAETIPAPWLNHKFAGDFQMEFNKDRTKLAYVKVYKSTPFSQTNTGLFIADLLSGSVEQITTETERCGRMYVDAEDRIFFSLWVYATLNDYITHQITFTHTSRREIEKVNYLTFINTLIW